MIAKLEENFFGELSFSKNHKLSNVQRDYEFTEQTKFSQGSQFKNHFNMFFFKVSQHLAYCAYRKSHLIPINNFFRTHLNYLKNIFFC